MKSSKLCFREHRRKPYRVRNAPRSSPMKTGFSCFLRPHAQNPTMELDPSPKVYGLYQSHPMYTLVPRTNDVTPASTASMLMFESTIVWSYKAENLLTIQGALETSARLSVNCSSCIMR